MIAAHLRFLARLLIALAIFQCHVLRADDKNVETVKLRQTSKALEETYGKGKRMYLPRMALLDKRGRLIYGGMGETKDVRRVLDKAVHESKPIDSAISLEAILAEAETTGGSTIAAAQLPSADYYVVDYWAEWCVPCRMLNRDLQNFMGGHKDKKFVWLQVESDPQKLPH